MFDDSDTVEGEGIGPRDIENGGVTEYIALLLSWLYLSPNQVISYRILLSMSAIVRDSLMVKAWLNVEYCLQS